MNSKFLYAIGIKVNLLKGSREYTVKEQHTTTDSTGCVVRLRYVLSRQHHNLAIVDDNVPEWQITPCDTGK